MAGAWIWYLPRALPTALDTQKYSASASTVTSATASIACEPSIDFSLSPPQFLAPERQAAHALAGGGEYGIGDGGCDRRHRRLADAARRRVARHDMHLDGRRLGQPHHPIGVEITLHHAALVDA